MAQPRAFFDADQAETAMPSRVSDVKATSVIDDSQDQQHALAFQKNLEKFR